MYNWEDNKHTFSILSQEHWHSKLWNKYSGYHFQSFYEVNNEVPEQIEKFLQTYKILIKLLAASLSFLTLSVLMFLSDSQIFFSAINWSMNPNGTLRLGLFLNRDRTHSKKGNNLSSIILCVSINFHAS